jgi:hypothetical protein
MQKNQIIIGAAALVLLSIIGTYFVTMAVINSKNSDFNKLESINLNSKSLSTPNININSQSKKNILQKTETSILDSVDVAAPQTTKTPTPLKFTNEASFEKTVNKKSAEPISEDENGVKTYIVGVPGVTTYSKDNYAVTANIITKAMVDADTNNPDQALNQKIINNLDNIIAKKSNDVESLQSLYRTGFGGALIKFGADLDGYSVKGLDTQRVYMSLGGQSHPLSPEINILGKKGDEYVLIRTLLYSYDTYPQNLKTQFDNNQNTDFDKMLKIYLDDKGTQNAIKITTSNLTNQFAVAE